ncbi:hypothetical protein EK21DRAFT_117987 [Setomelanomma holmii]|uniref:Major facilitator superfamily (MFS) profile domain-containing protein n=1 Tax=Setomelanomma holmii TaxID=210430 RepID=A0A9P4GY92_9PLEO|nr:hypothetical protein EK21DRAFT_117987 [Setomelanomma holmii]
MSNGAPIPSEFTWRRFDGIEIAVEAEIAQQCRSLSVPDAEHAFTKARSFWRLVGIAYLLRVGKLTALSTAIRSPDPDAKHDAIDRDNIDSEVTQKAAHGSPEILSDKELMNNAYEAENREHENGLWEAVMDHPMACFWAFVFCLTIVMESCDMFFNGNFLALTAFKERYGVFVEGSGYTIPTKWQSSLSPAGQCVHMGGEPSLLDLVKGTDLRRTAITCLIYASQNLAGNLIANQATFFFECKYSHAKAGMTTDWSFKLNFINSCLQLVANGLAWSLSGWLGRRTIFLGGAAVNATLFILDICASIPQSSATNFAQACLGVVISFVFAGTLGPISYSIIAGTSSVRLCALSTGLGRAAYYVAEIPMIYLASQMLNPAGWNMAGKCGYVWGGTAVICFVSAYFGLPEFKNRSYRELDILFNRKFSARKFKSTVIEAMDNE